MPVARTDWLSYSLSSVFNNGGQLRFAFLRGFRRVTLHLSITDIEMTILGNTDFRLPLETNVRSVAL